MPNLPHCPPASVRGALVHDCQLHCWTLPSLACEELSKQLKVSSKNGLVSPSCLQARLQVLFLCSLRWRVMRKKSCCGLFSLSFITKKLLKGKLESHCHSSDQLCMTQGPSVLKRTLTNPATHTVTKSLSQQKHRKKKEPRTWHRFNHG